MVCQNCGKDIIEDSIFCMYCGTKQEHKKVCTNCQTELPNDAIFCFKCGTAISDITIEAKQYTRKDIFTSRKGFYANSKYQYTLKFNKYADYKHKLYFVKAQNKTYDLIYTDEFCENPIVLTTINGKFQSINVSNVNATGIYILANSENQYKILWYTLIGDFYKEINIPNTDINLMDICESRLYYTTTNKDGENIAVYLLDLKTGIQKTIITKAKNCSINDIIGAYNDIYLHLTYSAAPKYPYDKASGWFKYNIPTEQMTFISNSTITPQMISTQPELFITDYESNNYIAPKDRNWLTILSFDVINQELYFLKENKEQQTYDIYRAPVSNINDITNTYRSIPFNTAMLDTNDDLLHINGERLYFDGKNLFWSHSYYELYQLQTPKTLLPYPHDKHGTVNNFEVFNTTIYLEDLLAPKQFIPRNIIPQKDGTLYDINNTKSV